MNNIAPIAFFVYNRPEHTKRTLDSLFKNQLSAASVLYIFSDGPKDESDAILVNEVRKFISNIEWCKQAVIFTEKTNKGLAASITEGVTYVLNHHDSVIVLEDDLLVSRGFLKYMNDALRLYKSYSKVMHISGFMFPIKKKLPETIFFKQASCWGWATWADRWIFLERSPQILYNKLLNSDKIREMDIDGTGQFVLQLQNNLNGKIKTWAILWHCSVLLNNGLCLHPRKSLVRNIGFDNSGTNCVVTNQFNLKPIQHIKVEPIPIQDYCQVYKWLQEFYDLPKKNANAITLQLFKIIKTFFFRNVLKLLFRNKKNEKKVKELLTQFRSVWFPNKNWYR